MKKKNILAMKIGKSHGIRFSRYYFFFVLSIMSKKTEKVTLSVEEIVQNDVKKEEKAITESKKTVADMEKKKIKTKKLSKKEQAALKIKEEEAEKKAAEDKARIEAERKKAEEDKKKEAERIRLEEDKKKAEEEEAKKKAQLQKKEEAAMEAKMKKWLLEEEKGEEELRQLMNEHPNQFQNVDPFFFSNTLEKMRSTIETQKALKRVRHEEARKNADQARLQAARRRGGGFGMLRLF